MERDSSTHKVKDIPALILKIKKYKLFFLFIREKEVC